MKLNGILFTKFYYSNHPANFNGTNSFSEQNDLRNLLMLDRAGISRPRLRVAVRLF
jgi:hypothetical protein